MSQSPRRTVTYHYWPQEVGRNDRYTQPILSECHTAEWPYGDTVRWAHGLGLDGTVACNEGAQPTVHPECEATSPR